MPRKTINVADLTHTANNLLRVSTCEPGIRKGIMNMIEHVLHETGNYRGFRYLMHNEVPAGNHRPGINYDPTTNMPYEDMGSRFGGTDNTRVQYTVDNG